MPTLLVRCPNRRDSFPCVLTDGIFFHVSRSNKVQRNATSSYRGKRRSPATNTPCAMSNQDGILFHARKVSNQQKHTNSNRLDTIQYKALLLATGAMRETSLK